MAVVVVMVYQAVRQELNLRDLRARMVQNSVDVKRKEEAIMEEKNKIQELKATLSSVNAKLDELKKSKADSLKTTEEFAKNLQTCNSEKARDTLLLFVHKLCINCIHDKHHRSFIPPDAHDAKHCLFL